ncbi:MAG TPA: hypothetical protein VIW24_28700 [Aldersonia sp.]
MTGGLANSVILAGAAIIGRPAPLGVLLYGNALRWPLALGASGIAVSAIGIELHIT